MFGKRCTLLICTLLTATFLAVAANECWSRYLNLQENQDVIFQSSTISALLVGVYDGNMTCKELSEKGDFGLGTFQGLDGEMIGLDGRFYQVKVDGAVYSVDDSTKTPFAVVTFFESDKTVQVEEAMNCSRLEQYLDSLLPTKNIMYAVKMVGRFTYLKTRSVPKQNPPYPRLSE
ncbi:MAG: acetolactate decarboxylase, partial [Candidatus Bathyarchaeota archaeon]|nr:acetolactate decarboxylase [Candidatus Bathyarchaeota archaeon]